MNESIQQRNKGHVIGFILFTLAIILLAWFTHKRIADFESYHLSIAHISANSTAEKVSAFVIERKRLVRLFANSNIDLIRRVSSEGNVNAAYIELTNRARQFFPESFAFTIADPTGEPIYEDFDGLVGARCEDDIKSFALEEQYTPYIHPHPRGYHFDIMSRYGYDGNEGILFVSFLGDVLSRILKSEEAPNHSLMLINFERKNLIEVVANGARDVLERENFYMTEEEKSRLMVRSFVNNTRWQVGDFFTPNLFSLNRAKIYSESLVILILIVIIFLGCQQYYIHTNSGLNTKNKTSIG